MASCTAKPAPPHAERAAHVSHGGGSVNSSHVPVPQRDVAEDGQAARSLPGSLLRCVELFSAQDPNPIPADSPSSLARTYYKC